MMMMMMMMMTTTMMMMTMLMTPTVYSKLLAFRPIFRPRLPCISLRNLPQTLNKYIL